ncbi:hypothetical protein GCM10009037_29180 [Halarchaeum grantii]|uniref:Uncharacterized protein n=1 Tax=Halarchaeum grantii TaxID=1193105 RepID=A0A830F0S8_9EURY|nr:hypothetical protein GCM10009037_29180 [Halarchaeum grantii]
MLIRSPRCPGRIAVSPGAERADLCASSLWHAGMSVLRTLWKLARTGFVLVGLLAVGFVVLSYGWNGEPPELSLE